MNNDKLKFKAEMFQDGVMLTANDELFVPMARAQSIFDEWLKKQTVVSGVGDTGGIWTVKKYDDDTHCAYLVCPTALEGK